MLGRGAHLAGWYCGQIEKAGEEALLHCPPGPGQDCSLEQRSPGQVSLRCGLGTSICDLGTMAPSASQEV